MMGRLTTMSVHIVAWYYWARKWMAYPMIGLPAWILMWFWLKHQAALELRSQGVWSSPPDFAKWNLGWALAIIFFVPGLLTAWWFKASDWAWHKSDFWGMDQDKQSMM